MFIVYSRERPAAIPVEVRSIDDTSNFDEFPDVELKIRKCDEPIVAASKSFRVLPLASATPKQDTDCGIKDWVFINYTFKRFEGLTQRGVKQPRKS